MAISEFTEVVLNIAEEVGGYRKTAAKTSGIPLMQESVDPRTMRSNLQTSSREERQALLRKNGVNGVLSMYRGK